MVLALTRPFFEVMFLVVEFGVMEFSLEKFRPALNLFSGGRAWKNNRQKVELVKHSRWPALALPLPTN